MPAPQLLLISWILLILPARAEDVIKPPAPPAACAGESAPGPADPLASLDGAQIQDLFQWLSRHATDPAALSQDALNRAALRGLLQDPRTGALVVETAAAAPLPVHPPLFARLRPTAAYAQPGPLTGENLRALANFLGSLPPEVTTLLLDLRAPQPPASLAGAAAFASLFLPDKTPLFLLQSSATPLPAAVPPTPTPTPLLHSATGLKAWDRRVWLLLDERIPPPAELAAHLLVHHLQALSFGTPTPGTLTETIDRPLGPSHLVRLPAATVSWPDGTRLTGTALVPQVRVPAAPDSREALLTLTDPAALPALLLETDRPRLNEAALMAATPPELTTTRLPTTAPRPDPVLQQAIDLLETSALLKLDAPEEIKRPLPGR
ncbi:MAG: hypothetical protein V4675_07415 [Verrucomicrobiota bacterium]